MTQLFFIHGINNQENSPNTIKKSWFESLIAGAKKAGLELPTYTDVFAPFYGDVLHEETKKWKKGGYGLIEMSAPDSSETTNAVAELFMDYQAGLGISDEEVMKHVDASVVEKGDGIHKGWLKAISRALEDVLPSRGKYLARIFLPQAGAYLDKPGLIDKIDGLVRDQLMDAGLANEDAVIICHSLGTIIAYRVLRELRGQVNVPILVTLGSPLGINIVKKKLNPPRLMPQGVSRWINGADKDDFVALHPNLNKRSFGTDGIENILSFNNSDEDKHAIEDYLKHAPLLESIVDHE